MNEIIIFCSRTFIAFLQRNISFTLVAAVILLGRLLLKRFPKRYAYGLWIALGVRALFDIGLPVKLPKIHINMPVLSASGTATTVNPGLLTGKIPAQALGTAEISTAQAPGLSVLQIITAGLFAAWVAGIVFMVLKGVMGYIRIRKNTRISFPEGNNLYRCDYINSPMAFGFINPKIYIPADNTTDSLQCVIEHERVHIKRGDVYFKLLAFLILSGYWINPLAWVCFKQFTLDMELSCDEAVIAGLGTQKKNEYLDWLLFYSADRKNVSLAPTAFGETETKRRIKNIMSFKKKSLLTLAFGLLLALAVTLFCFLKFDKTEALAAVNDTVTESSEPKTDKEVIIDIVTPSEPEESVTESEVPSEDETPASGEGTVDDTGSRTWAWPVSENLGRVARGYSDDHRAIDIAAPTGTPAKAIMYGTVEEVDYTAQAGNYIIVRVDSETTYRFNHLDSVSVKVGDTVSVGDKLGEIGSTGYSTGPHLHVEVIVNGESIKAYEE